MPSLSEESLEETSPEAVSPEGLSEEASIEGPYIKPSYKTFHIPPHWPRWDKICGAKLRNKNATCRKYAVIGNPRCKYHGSGGEVARMHGQMRYMCWIITGGPQNMPVEHACAVALYVFAEAVLNQGVGTVDQQIKAAMWLTSLIEHS